MCPTFVHIESTFNHIQFPYSRSASSRAIASSREGDISLNSLLAKVLMASTSRVPIKIKDKIYLVASNYLLVAFMLNNDELSKCRI